MPAGFPIPAGSDHAATWFLIGGAGRETSQTNKAKMAHKCTLVRSFRSILAGGQRMMPGFARSRRWVGYP